MFSNISYDTNITLERTGYIYNHKNVVNYVSALIIDLLIINWVWCFL